MSKQELTINLPCSIEVDDYHEFYELERFLQKISGTKKIKVREVGFNAPNYVGIIYLRKDEQYKKLLRTLDLEARILDGKK